MLSPEIITMIGIGLAAIVILGTQNWRYNSMTQDRLSDLQKQTSDLESKTDVGLEKIEVRVNALDKQMSHLDGFLEGLRDAIGGHRAA